MGKVRLELVGTFAVFYVGKVSAVMIPPLYTKRVNPPCRRPSQIS